MGMLATSADATRYEVLSGELAYWESGETNPLEGFLDAAPVGPDGLPAPSTPRGEQFWRIDDFALIAAGEHFGPAQPIEHEGLGPALWVANGLLLEEDGRVPNFAMRSGGEFVSANGDRVIFRFFNWVGDPIGNRARGMLPDGSPARFDLRGRLVEREQAYRLPPDSCPVSLPTGEIDLPTRPSGGVTIETTCVGCSEAGGTLSIGTGGEIVPSGSGSVTRPTFPGLPLRPGNDIGAVTLIAQDLPATPLRPGNLFQGFQSFDLGSGDTARFSGDPGIANLVVRITPDAPAIINGTLESIIEGSVIVIGADLSLSLPPIDRPTAGVTLSTDSTSIASVPLEASTTLSIVGLSIVGLPPEAEAPPVGGEVILQNPPTPPLFCDFLLPTSGGAPPRTIGTFEFSAAAVEQVEIAIEPRRRHRPINPLRRSKLRVAILGSEAFDVRDVRIHSLRFGPDEAPPAGRRRPRFRDVNRDGFRDLVVRFRSDETGVSAGDTSMCLHGESARGTAIRGCAPVDTRPREHHRGHWHDRHDRHDRDDRDDRRDRHQRHDD